MYEMTQEDWGRCNQVVDRLHDRLRSRGIEFDDWDFHGFSDDWTLFRVPDWKYEVEFHDSLFQYEPIALADALLEAAKGEPL